MDNKNKKILIIEDDPITKPAKNINKVSKSISREVACLPAQAGLRLSQLDINV